MLQTKNQTLDIPTPKEKTPLFAKIMSWDLTEVREFLLEENAFSGLNIDQAEEEYKRFILLTIIYPNEIIPTSKEVDKMWHAHIIFTHNYFAFCEKFNKGKYIHHNRSIDKLEKELVYYYEKNTLRLYKETFGTIDKIFWATNAQICWGS